MDFISYLPFITAFLVSIPFLMLFRKFVFQYIKNSSNQNLRSGFEENRLQAYERMTIYLERLKPANLVGKFTNDLHPNEFLILTEKYIKEEFDYNTAQQLYIPQSTWIDILNSKNELLKLLIDTYKNLHPNAKLDDYKNLILMNYLSGEDYISATINQMRKEILLIHH